ncbi:MAG TPA: hypothetical protein DCL08_02810 [Anaerolineaceae bacterium]|nr:MAG: hypothetical protein XE06_0358 [Anaerolineaceae bacterium 46_22]HAF48155.1 hypothetical protein [Anaerolineaceae bacterium]
MKLKNKHLFWIFALLAAISFDILFWERPFGINFFIFILLAAFGGLIPAWMEKIHIPWTSYLLLVPLAFFSVMTFIRAEPFTIAVNVLVTLSALAFFLMSLRNGAWYRYSLRDIFVSCFQFLLNNVIGGILFFNKTRKADSSQAGQADNGDRTADVEGKQDQESQGGNSEKKEKPLKGIAPYLRGLLLALPILGILTFFLAQADPIFNDRIQNSLAWFRIENLGEMVFRLAYILVIAYVLLSSYYFAVVESKKYQPDDNEKPAISPFLGSIESSVVLGAVNLLFLMFVILQFNYLFSGGKNISLEGYTYAEYARRGFFELIAVAVISLVLFYILSMITKREQKNQGRLFSALGLILVGLVAIILTSAYIRLNLYEAAYGFTRLRTLAHVFMIWIALLLGGVAILEITRNMKRLAFILILFIIGFGLTINLLNTDQFIVNQNISRAINNHNDKAESDLDSGYLYSLSADAIPNLVEFYIDENTPDDIRDELGGVLACKLAQIDVPQDESWVSYHYSRSQANTLLAQQSENLEVYPVSYDMYTWFVEVNGEVKSCSGYQADPYD